MINKTKKTDVSIVAPLLTLIVFSVCVLFVLLFGARLYKEALDRDNANFRVRTVDQYITTRFRQGDGDTLSFISDFENNESSSKGDTLFFVEFINGERYFTRVYSYNGYLYELFSSADDEFERGDGEPIIELESLYFEEIDGVIYITIGHSNGEKDVLKFIKRSGNGGNYEK